MKKYKKVYVEVTNRCNLSCDFCIQNKRCNKSVSVKEFYFILNKLKQVTNYLYFHLLGEPLMHLEINKLINMASENFYVNITTNGYLIERIKNNKNIRQINISLHSYDERYKISLDNYLENIFNSVDELIRNNTYISLRLWVKTKYKEDIISRINRRYNCDIDLSSGNYKINSYLFINESKEFVWPDLGNDYYSNEGSCYGLIDHFGVLVDGTVVPCCLDTEGIIRLGNIYVDDLNDILCSERCNKMIEGFKQNKKCEELCKHCLFLDK